MIEYIERKLLEEWLDKNDLNQLFNESWEDSYNVWLQSYYTDNIEDWYLESFLLIKNRKSSYEEQWKSFWVTWAWLKYIFKKIWLELIKIKTKWMITWACKQCSKSINYYSSKNRKFCSFTCRVTYNKWEEE